MGHIKLPSHYVISNTETTQDIEVKERAIKNFLIKVTDMFV